MSFIRYASIPVFFALVALFLIVKILVGVLSKDVSPASLALRQAWETKLGDACLPSNENGVHWCGAYVRLKKPNSGSQLTGPETMVVHVTAIYRDGRVRLQESRAIHPIPIEVDIDTFVSVEAEKSELAMAFRSSSN